MLICTALGIANFLYILICQSEHKSCITCLKFSSWWVNKPQLLCAQIGWEQQDEEKSKQYGPCKYLICQLSNSKSSPESKFISFCQRKAFGVRVFMMPGALLYKSCQYAIWHITTISFWFCILTVHGDVCTVQRHQSHVPLVRCGPQYSLLLFLLLLAPKLGSRSLGCIICRRTHWWFYCSCAVRRSCAGSLIPQMGWNMKEGGKKKDASLTRLLEVPD